MVLFIIHTELSIFLPTIIFSGLRGGFFKTYVIQVCISSKGIIMEKKIWIFVLLPSLIILYSIFQKREYPQKIENLAEISVNKYKLDDTPIKVESPKISYVNSISSEANMELEKDISYTKDEAIADNLLSPLLSAIQVKQKESMENRFNAINDRLTKEPNKSVIDVMGAIFDEEPTDLSWARENEERIYNFFRNGNDFLNFSPESVDCKSSSCQVIIAAPDEGIGIDIQNKISHQLSKNPTIILNNYSATVDPESARLIIYFHRNEI